MNTNPNHSPVVEPKKVGSEAAQPDIDRIARGRATAQPPKKGAEVWPTDLSALRRYVLAVLAVAVAFLVRWLLWPILGSEIPFLLHWPAVMVAAWYGGVRPGIFATVLAAGGTAFFILEPRFSFSIARPGEAAGVVIFLLTGFFLSFVCAKAQHSGRDLFESAMRLRMAVSAANVGLWDWDLRTNKVYFSPEWKRQIGYADHEISDDFNEWQSRVHPDDLEATLAAVHVYLVNASPKHQVEFRFRHKDGSYRWIMAQASALCDETGKPVRMLGSHVDITDRRTAEQELQDNHNRLRAILDSMFPLVGLLSLEGIILEVNRAPLQIAGLRREDVIGKSCGDAHWFSYSPTVQAAVGDALTRAARGETVRFDTPIRIAGEQLITIDLMFGPVRDSQGKVVQIVGSAVDITAKKKAEEDLHKLNAELEQRVCERTAQLEAANQELEAFAYSVSHDLRSPLRAVDGFSRILQEDHGSHLPPDAQDALAEVRAGVRKMGTLIDDLLAFSRLGRQAMCVQTLQPAELVESVLGELRPGLEGRKVEITVGELPPCVADRALLRQVFLNLLDNAFKFTRGREPAKIEVGSYTTLASLGEEGHGEKKGETVYFVKDNGVGFDMDYAHKLFQVFQRLHSAAQFEGTGIGLALVQRIIKKLGGRVWGEGAVDQGATFSFSLPTEVRHDS